MVHFERDVSNLAYKISLIYIIKSPIRVYKLVSESSGVAWVFFFTSEAIRRAQRGEKMLGGYGN